MAVVSQNGLQSFGLKSIDVANEKPAGDVAALQSRSGAMRLGLMLCLSLLPASKAVKDTFPWPAGLEPAVGRIGTTLDYHVLSADQYPSQYTATVSLRVVQTRLRSTPQAPAAATAASNVLVLILGQVRTFLTKEVLGSQRMLIEPLQKDFGVEHVHLYLCADPGYKAKLEVLRIADTVPTVFEANSSSMFQHMSTCYRKTAAHTMAQAPPLEIKWFVRSRFDNVFFQPVPTLKGLATDSVHARARKVGHGWKNVDSEMFSWWAWEDVCGVGPNEHKCEYRDPRQPDPSGLCMLMDDQFAYVPSAFAAAYFGTSEARPNLNYSMPSAHVNCEWAEGELTCRLLGFGAKLQILRVATRLDKNTKSGGSQATRAPTEPSHICHADAAMAQRAQSRGK